MLGQLKIDKFVKLYKICQIKCLINPQTTFKFWNLNFILLLRRNVEVGTSLITFDFNS